MPTHQDLIPPLTPDTHTLQQVGTPVHTSQLLTQAGIPTNPNPLPIVSLSIPLKNTHTPTPTPISPLLTSPSLKSAMLVTLLTMPLFLRHIVPDQHLPPEEGEAAVIGHALAAQPNASHG